MNRLYVFPVRFPYTKVVECFLADEFPYLAKQFDEVVVLPLKKELPNAQDVPSNCKACRPIFENKYTFFLRGLFCSRSFWLLWSDFFKNKVWTSKTKLKVWLVGYITINSLLNSKAIKDVENVLNPRDVCYFYWGKWSNVLSIFWKDKAKCVSRFHGWGDLWEMEYGEYFPLRNFVTSSIDCAFHISSIGESYFKKKYPLCQTTIARLGSFDGGVCPKNSIGCVNIVSCSSLWPLKRVNLIQQSVALLSEKYNMKVCWTHMGGDGIDLQNLKNKAANYQTDKFRLVLLGSLKHADVLEYYKANPFDLFVNLSTIEGVPVSIMEAISYDIPIVATNVGGTADIVVSNRTGELVSSNPTVEEVADTMYEVLNKKQSYSPRLFWDENFNAEKNYTKFALLLKQISCI